MYITVYYCVLLVLLNLWISYVAKTSASQRFPNKTLKKDIATIFRLNYDNTIIDDILAAFR